MEQHIDDSIYSMLANQNTAPSVVRNDGGATPTFGWEKMNGLYRGDILDGDDAIDTRKAYFFYIRTFNLTQSKKIRDAIDVIKTLTEGLKSNDPAKMWFDDNGNIAIQRNNQDIEILRNQLDDSNVPGTAIINQEYNVRNYMETAGGTTSSPRWILDPNIVFNRNLKYFIKYHLTSDDGSEGVYKLYYNPIHRVGFKDWYTGALLGDRQAVVANYCVATATNPYAEKGLSSESRWGDPTCGCTNGFSIPGFEFGQGINDKIQVTDRAWTDASENYTGNDPYWPWRDLSGDEDEARAYYKKLADYMTKSTKLIEFAPCGSPACRISAPESSYYTTFTKNLKDNLTCDNNTTFNISSCNISNNSAGANTFVDTVFGCDTNGGGGGGDSETDNDQDENSNNSKVMSAYPIYFWLIIIILIASILTAGYYTYQKFFNY